MTEGLKELLQHYGALSVTLSHLLSERPGTKYKNLDEYYKALGGILPNEPVLVVKISKDGETRFLEDGEHDVAFEDETGSKAGIVTVWELPEDEFWFFRAFRPGLFDLDKDLPPFVYEMGVVHAYAMFEGYLSDLLRARLRKHPQLLGSHREIKYEQVFAAAHKDELINTMVEREIRDLMYLPFFGLIKKMRDQLGFRFLTDKYDDRVNCLSLLRNCLLHNHSKVDSKLATARPSLYEGDKLQLAMEDVSETVNVLRKFAYEIDKAFERTGLESTSSGRQ